MRQIAIIADDITGASDSGVQFARKGFKTQVIFDTEHLSDEMQDIEVIVLDTDSRSVSGKIAYEQSKEAAIQVRQLGFKHVYKKMDSTLRGNLGVEIDAIADSILVDFTVAVPAFPKIGRTTRNGVHYLNEISIDQTEIARDPKCPVTESNLVKLFNSQSKRKTGLIPLEILRAGKKEVLFHIRTLLQEQIEIIVFDAVTEEDMQQIAEIMAASDYRILWAGSAGLADYLPEALSLKNSGNKELNKAISITDKPVLLVAGSISQVTRNQVAAFNREPEGS